MRNKLFKILGGLSLTFVLFGFTTQLVMAQEYPEPTGFVVDEANVISDEVEADLTTKLKALQKEGKAEVAVVTVQTISPLEIEEYSIELAEKWKVGDKEVDNGIIFILAVDDRKTRIEVGTGMEGILNDAKAGRILDNNAVPYFKNNNWEEGIVKTTEALIQVAQGNEEAIADGATEEYVPDGAVIGVIVVFIVIGVFVVATPTEVDDVIFFGLLRALASGSSGKGKSGKTFSGGGFSGGGSSRGF